MNTEHRFILGGLFLCHGLARTALALMILTSNTAMNFSASMILFGMAVPSIFGGYNLLAGHSSTHKILPLAAVINLFSFPEGVFLSVYYYWYWKYKCNSPNPFRENRVTGSEVAVNS